MLSQICINRRLGEQRWHKDTVEVVVLDVAECVISVLYNWRNVSLFFHVHQQSHELIHTAHVHVTAVIPADHHLFIFYIQDKWKKECDDIFFTDALRLEYIIFQY